MTEPTPPAYLRRNADLQTKVIQRSSSKRRKYHEEHLNAVYDTGARLVDYFISKDLYNRDQCPRPEIIDGIKIYYHYLDQLDAEDYGIFLEPFITASENTDGTCYYSAETYDKKLGGSKDKVEAVRIAKKYRDAS